MSEKLKEILQKQVKKEAENKPENILQVVGFLIGNEEFAVPILNVQEIVKPIEYTRRIIC